VVEYDSIILPGRAGKVVQQIKPEKLGSGPFTKSITVISNAKNLPTLQLTLSGKILSLIHLSNRYLTLRADKQGVINGTLSIGAEKKDMQILKVVFKEHASDQPAWQQQPPIVLKPTVTRSENADSDGYYTYTLNFSHPLAMTRVLSGVFSLTTDYAKSELIEVRGMISPSDQ
jgi:hypothetical protein